MCGGVFLCYCPLLSSKENILGSLNNAQEKLGPPGHALPQCCPSASMCGRQGASNAVSYVWLQASAVGDRAGLWPLGGEGPREAFLCEAELSVLLRAGAGQQGGPPLEPSGPGGFLSPCSAQHGLGTGHNIPSGPHWCCVLDQGS